MLSAINISQNKINFTSFRLISEDSFIREDKRTQIGQGDVLLTIVGAIGRAAIVTSESQKFTLQRSVAVIRPLEVLPKFVMYQLESPSLAAHFNKQAKGTAQKGIYLRTLGLTDIAVPPLAEQHRIVAKIEELFSEIDKGVESLKTAKAQLQVYRQALLKHAFEGKLTAQWRADNPDKVVPAAQLLAQIKQAREERYQQQLDEWKTAVEKWEFGGKEGRKPSKPQKLKSIVELDNERLKAYDLLPSEWFYLRAEEVSDFITKGTTPSKDNLFSGSGGIPFIKVYNLTKNGTLDFSVEPTFTDIETHNHFLARSKVYPDDLRG